MEKATIRRIARAVVTLALMAVPFVFVYAHKNQVGWLLLLLRSALWTVTVWGYLNIAVFLWHTSLEDLAFRARQRKIGWLLFATNIATVAMAWTAGWYVVATLYGLLLAVAFTVRFIGRERLIELERSIRQ